MLRRMNLSSVHRRWLLFAARSVATDNFEPLKRPELPGKVRMGFIPEEWFQLFYDKTGVTGPYVFGAGLLTFLCSKEIYVMEHEYYSGLSLAIMSVLAVQKLGPTVANWLDKGVDQIEVEWTGQRDVEMKNIQNAIEAEKLEQWRADGALMLMDIKKENIDLQIEAANREAAMQAYHDVRQRLDHEVACNYVYSRMNQKNMVQWIVRNAMNELPDKHEGEVMEKAMADLSALAVRAK